MNNVYTAGQLAELAGVSSRTVRYYDEKGLLKPNSYSDGGYRLYDNDSLLQLQKIKMLQVVGLSLEEISKITTYQEGTGVVDVLWERKLVLKNNKSGIHGFLNRWSFFRERRCLIWDVDTAWYGFGTGP